MMHSAVAAKYKEMVEETEVRCVFAMLALAQHLHVSFVRQRKVLAEVLKEPDSCTTFRVSCVWQWMLATHTRLSAWKLLPSPPNNALGVSVYKRVREAPPFGIFEFR